MIIWEQFLKEKMQKVFSENSTVVDIGGGLRISKEKSNRYNQKRREWVEPYLSKTEYVVLDPVSDYNPDIVGDIHNLPFEDNSQEAFTCIAVLEHVEDPIRACREMYRTLKPGGHCLVYVPFLYNYHAQEGYYKDYWRFTKDSLAWIFKDYSFFEMCPVRGALETWINLSPLNKFSVFNRIARFCDKTFGKIKSNQVSGYYLFAIK